MSEATSIKRAPALTVKRLLAFLVPALVLVMLRIGSLFSGIGGLELGLEQAGVGRVVWQVEINPFCRAVLAQHWPHVDRSVVDVRAASPVRLAPVDALCGGFPCQDLSVAGKGAGLDGARSGLWREYRRAVAEFKPWLCVVENVASGASRWLPFVEADLAALGYRTQALHVRAVDVGAPHRRARIFVVAYADGVGLQAGSARGSRGERGGRSVARRSGRRSADPACPAVEGRGLLGSTAECGRGSGDVADAHGEQLREQQQRLPRRRARGVRDEGATLVATDGGRDDANVDARGLPRVGQRGQLDAGERTPGERDADGRGGPRGSQKLVGPDAQPAVDRGAHGVPDGLVPAANGAGVFVRWPAGRGEPQHAWEPPRTVWRDSVPDHEAALTALGNAVVPQCGELVGSWIVARRLGGRRE